MTEKDIKLENEIRQRAMMGRAGPTYFDLSQADPEGPWALFTFQAHNDRSYLLAALDREREETKRLRGAIQAYWDKRFSKWADECNPDETELYEALDQ